MLKHLGVFKQYPLKKWQKIINTIYKDIPFVQMSMPDKKVIDNVINIANDIKNFRHAALMLKYASLFIATEGGFCMPQMFIIQNVYVFLHLCLTQFGQNIIMLMLYGLKKIIILIVLIKVHVKCLEAMNNHNENIMINKIKKHFKI